MKASTFTRFATFTLVVALLAGCASTPTLKKAGPGAVFQQPIAKVQKAAVEALSATGFNVTKQQPTYVEGKRPRKVGLFVGSGGETVGVWLTARGSNSTEVKVDTAKTFAGYAGQKTWNDKILAKMRQLLAQ